MVAGLDVALQRLFQFHEELADFFQVGDYLVAVGVALAGAQLVAGAFEGEAAFFGEVVYLFEQGDVVLGVEAHALAAAGGLQLFEL